jgi:hypothetical protein
VESKEEIGILLQIPKHQIELLSLSLSQPSKADFFFSMTFFIAKPKKGRKFNS